MKLLNKSIFYLSVSLFFIIGLWSTFFYFNMLNEIKESVDEGLDNYKRQIIYNAQKDSSVLAKNNFEEGFYTISEISQVKAAGIKDRYIDTLVLMQDSDDQSPELEPVRFLTTAFELKGHYYELHILNSMVEEDDLVEELIYDAVWLYLLLVISLIVINNFVLKHLWKPFYSFLNQLKNYRIGISQNLPETKTETKEFADLQNAVNVLLQRTIKTYEQQKQFIGNASHELQTPLAIVINKLELLIEKGDLQNEQAENIAEVMRIIERLVRLNKSLLLLTRIENKQFFDNETVSVNEVVRQCINDMEDIAEFKKVKISFSEKANLITQTDISLAHIVISNLLRNAVYHNHVNGYVHIEIFENTLRITNSGNESPIDEHQVFSRFHKSGKNSNGTGLGLAIVKAVCELYGYKISYHFEDGSHTFVIGL